MLTFVWDEQKNLANLQKHGVTFSEARTVFLDEYARLIADPDSSDTEDRFLLLGYSERFQLLLVCHCYRENDAEIRIISARKATSSEKAAYTRYRKP
jgi:uncharacterized DUF497 family protein